MIMIRKKQERIIKNWKEEFKNINFLTGPSSFILKN